MIANDFEEFVGNVAEAARLALNTGDGKEITAKLLEAKLAENPGMTQEDWERSKAGLMAFVFAEFVKECPGAMEEMARHLYNEMRQGNA